MTREPRPLVIYLLSKASGGCGGWVACLRLRNLPGVFEQWSSRPLRHMDRSTEAVEETTRPIVTTQTTCRTDRPFPCTSFQGSSGVPHHDHSLSTARTSPLIPISLDRKEAMSSERRMPRCRHYHSGSVLEDTHTLTRRYRCFLALLAVDPEISSCEATGYSWRDSSPAMSPSGEDQARSMPIGLTNYSTALEFARLFARMPITVRADEKSRRVHFLVHGTVAETR